MEIIGSRRKSFLSPASDAAPTIPIYRSAPELEVRLEDFELYAVHRLRVLKGISDALSRGKKPNEMENVVKELLKVHMSHPEASQVMSKDIISHFVLRLVYCREEELRKWFLSMETTLFRYRFLLETSEAQIALMAEFDLPYKIITNAEYENLKDKLNKVARSMNSSADTIYYKAPFEKVPDLVARREVFIMKGYAYVARSQVVSLLVTHYRSHLSKALILTNRKWTSMIREQEKDRLTPIVEALSTSYLGPDYSQPKDFGEISLRDIDQIARSSFPLCMRYLFEKIKEDHHLKHGGRMQLGLFLKGVGLKLDDALAFWKSEFSKKVGAERFDKEYAYGIRHNYGKEGKRTSANILLDNPCRNFEKLSREENLRAALNNMGVANRALEDVMDKVRNKHYQLACTLTFEAVHGASCDQGINHPNQYYSDSKTILESRVYYMKKNLREICRGAIRAPLPIMPKLLHFP
ncbi:hypothetical protein SASPL_115952 [Salvia splendens]|uniref:DNA primase large subunit C-terminal domain-containing protein n=1 Tax=Salvia splendens TaxID=180675 RepID=A0A8X8Y3G1_SALSN|nr:hypothetical protein SASPL_115952 [Salvia splendens]